MNVTSKERLLGVLRHLITFIGGILLVYQVADASIIDEISGIALTLIGVILSWNANDKLTNLDKLKGVIRHIITTVAGYGVLKGWYDEQTLLTIVSVIFALLGTGWSTVDKKESKIVELAERRARAA